MVEVPRLIRPHSFETLADPPAVLHASQLGDLILGEGESFTARCHPGDGPAAECGQFQPDVRSVLEV